MQNFNVKERIVKNQSPQNRIIPPFLAIFLVLLASYSAYTLGSIVFCTVFQRLQLYSSLQSNDTGIVLMFDEDKDGDEDEDIDMRLMNEITNMLAEYPDIAIVINNYNSYPQSLVRMFVQNPETLDALLEYPNREKYADAVVNKSELSGGFPAIMQTDPRWAYTNYGKDFLAVTGCGPTCISAVAMYLTGNVEITPDAVANAAESSGNFIAGTGTSWEFMEYGAETFGLSGQEVALDIDIITSTLKNGQPIICSMKPGHFTTGAGHFIVLIGVNPDGSLLVHDPASKINSAKTWQFSDIKYQIKNMWTYTLK